jgi:hypothetical protein
LEGSPSVARSEARALFGISALQYGTPSLVCGFEELYRYLVDGFVLRYAINLSDKDFVSKDEDLGFYRKGKRES